LIIGNIKNIIKIYNFKILKRGIIMIIEIKDNARLKLKEYYSLGKEPCAIRIRVLGYT